MIHAQRPRPRFGASAAPLIALVLSCAGPNAEGPGAASGAAASAGAVEGASAAAGENAAAAATIGRAGAPTNPIPSPSSTAAAPPSPRPIVCSLPSPEDDARPAADTLAPIPSPLPGSLAEAPPVLRLPDDVHLQHTALSLSLDPSQPRFSGAAVMAIALTRPRATLWLHGRDLHVTAVWLDTAGARLPASWEQVNDDGLAKVSLPCLVSGRAALHVAWDAAFGTQLSGLYLAKEAGEAYVFSQFAAIDARRAIPSFDDPVFKTPWDLELTVRDTDIAITNAPQISQEPAGAGRKRLRFATTRPLPSYLLAFAVGPFDVVVPPPLPPNEVRKRPLQVRGLAPRGRGPELAFALQAGGEELVWLERWFGSEYPYEKLDHIAVPDFTYGAMENAGAITYRESRLLYTEGKSSPESQASIAGILAHEMAHQWFGDLVTPRWWTDAWLNESFATWLGTKAAQAWRPALRAELRLLQSVHAVMGDDALVSARAIRRPVLKLQEVWNQFDGLTYQKGAGVLGMFERWMGPGKMQAGVRRYLEDHRDGGGSSDDLLAAFSATAGRDVATPFRTFLEQPGVPLLRAELVCRGSSAQVLLAQQRQFPIGAETTAEQRAQRWQVPVCVRAGIGREVQEACTLLTVPTGTLALAGRRCPDWVMPNGGAAGYYTWTLAGRELERLAFALPKLPVRERMSFAHSLSAAWASGGLPADKVLAAAEALARDEDGAVANAPMSLLHDLREEVLRPAQRPLLEAFARDLYRPAAKRLGWVPAAGEEPRVRRQRESVLAFLAATGRDPEVRAEAARRGRAYANVTGAGFAPAAVSPGLQLTALAVAVQEGDEALFAALEARLATVEDAEDRQRILSALSSTRDPKLGARALRLSLDPRLRRNERGLPVAAQLSHPENRQAAWEFLDQRWDEVVAQVQERTAVSMAASAVAAFCDGARAQELASKLAPRVAKLPGADLEMVQALEAARLCEASAAAHRKQVEAFLTKRARPPAAR